MSTSEMDEVVQGRLRLQRDLVLEEHVDVAVAQNEKNWMDLNRKQIKAYEYLCHIGEAKQWIEACSDQQLPPVVELDEHLRNGVVLAKLAKKFKPDIVKRIFGEDAKLQFRHSDNINYFFIFCKTIDLPDAFVFELTDLYDKKNIPKVIYNIHALAHLLSAKKLAPAIKDLRGHLQFTNEELETTQKQIEELNLPDFNNAGAAVAKEMNLDPNQHLINHFTDDNSVDFHRFFRGALVRNQFKQQMNHYRAQQPFIIQFQSLFRHYVVRLRFKLIQQHLIQFLPVYILFQARIKSFQCRRNYIGHSNYYKLKSNEIVKIQSLWKSHHTRHLYRQLLNKPTYKSIEMFNHGNTNLDYQQELEASDLRQSVVKYIRDISTMETMINDLDLKVALIVKNRMSLEDIQLTSTSANQQVIDTNNNMYSVFKLMDKDSRHKQEVYQNLLYMLQTNPFYLSNIVLEMRQMTSETIKKFVEQSILTVYGYAQHPREEYLLLSLFNLIIYKEINETTELSDFIKSNPQFVRLVVNYIRGAKDRQFLSSILKDPIMQVFQSDVELDNDPISLYKKMIIKEETETGQKSSKKMDITKDEALQDPVIKVQYENMQRHTQELTSLFLSSIFASVHRMPYGIRCIANKVKSSLMAKFPNESIENINRIIGNLIFFRYINPAIVAPEAFDVISSDVSLTTQQRKNLSEISKLLNLISIGSSDSSVNSSNVSSNSASAYIASNSIKFQAFLSQTCQVVELQEYFQIDHYSDFILVKKPSLFISPTEIIGLHKLLLDYKIHLQKDDYIYTLLNDLDSLENITIDDVLSKKSKEQSFALLSNLMPHNDESVEIELKQLFTETKRLILIVMQHCQSRNLIELLNIQPTKESEESFLKEQHHSIGSQNKLDKDSAVLNSKLTNVNTVGRDTVSTNAVSASVASISHSTLQDIQKLILLNLNLLEARGKTSKKNGYQEIIASIGYFILI
eukprot:NODE_101_length_20473_cov_0.516590.p2 type:complete len:967 gc:universal NODE_101_length_20473_cov_0.516590:11338-8438(-)